MANKATRLMCMAGLIAASAAALAGSSDVVLAIHASSGRAEGVLEITADQGTWQGGSFFWSTDTAIPIMSGSEVLGMFGPGCLDLRDDPSVGMGFSVQAGTVDTTFTISSAMLTFPTIPDPEARAHGAFTVMDFTGSGAALTGMLPGGYGCRAYFQDGSTFCSAIQEIAVVPPDSLAVGSFEYPAGGGYEPVPPTGGMAMEMMFTLTADAFASGSAVFEVVPEPATLLLLVAALGLVRRR